MQTPQRLRINKKKQLLVNQTGLGHATNVEILGTKWIMQSAVLHDGQDK